MVAVQRATCTTKGATCCIRCGTRSTTTKNGSILRGLNETFWHQTVTTDEVEKYISQQSGIDFGLFFDQYLRTTKIPVLKYKLDGKQLAYQYDNVVDGYSYPILVKINDEEVWLTPTQAKKTLTRDEKIQSFEVDRNFYLTTVTQ